MVDKETIAKTRIITEAVEPEPQEMAEEVREIKVNGQTFGELILPEEWAGKRVRVTVIEDDPAIAPQADSSPVTPAEGEKTGGEAESGLDDPECLETTVSDGMWHRAKVLVPIEWVGKTVFVGEIPPGRNGGYEWIEEGE